MELEELSYPRYLMFLAMSMLHPKVSCIAVQANKTIEHEITGCWQREWEQNGQVVLESQLAQSYHSEMPEARVNKYGGLSPSQETASCSYSLCRLAELQQKLFNVNRCLFYVESDPQDSSGTIDELIAKVTG